MGQRHQAFLIARVRPHGAHPNDPGQRRCVGAIHHQWCYGIRPLLAMRRLITLMSHPENAAIVRAELRALDGRYGCHGGEEPEIPDDPCPYATSLLLSAYTTDLEAGREIYTSGETAVRDICPASMSCWGGHNDDGISVLDITEPCHPSYCFLLAEDVLDASGYLEPYDSLHGYRTSSFLPRGRTIGIGEDDTESESEDMDELLFQRDERWYQRLRLRAIKGLESVPIIRASVLEEAWPYVLFAETGPVLDSLTTTPETVASDTSFAVPSLVDLTFEAAVKHSLDTEDAFDFEQLVLLPGKVPEIKRILRDLNPFPDSGIQLLVRVLSELGYARVDLANFQLSGTQLVKVLSDCGNIAFLDTSFNSLLGADDIPKLLEVAPTLRRFVAIGCHSIIDAHILALVQNEPFRFKSLEGLLHPAFLTIMKPDPYPIAFTHIGVTIDGHLTCASVPFFTPAQVVQALIDILPWKDAKVNAGLGNYINPLAGFSAFHGSARISNEKFGQRAVVSVPFLSPHIPRRGQRDFWVFAMHRASRRGFVPRHVKDKKNMWGFVHVKGSGEHAVGDSEASSIASGAASGDDTTERLECSGRLYDLRGFLECMANEGRPMPSDAAVKELERILYKKHRKTGEFYCPFMQEEDMREVGIEPYSLPEDV